MRDHPAYKQLLSDLREVHTWEIRPAGNIRSSGCCPLTKKFGLSPMLWETAAKNYAMPIEIAKYVVAAADGRKQTCYKDIRADLLEACGLKEIK